MSKKDKYDELLNKIYYDAKTGLMGTTNLYKKAKKLDKSIRLSDVKKWLKKQATAQIHSRKPKKIIYLPIFSYNPGAFQMDLTEMKRLASQNRGYRYILTAININTRKLYAYKSKKKLGNDIKDLMKQFLKDVEAHNLSLPKNNRPIPPYVRTITTDSGSEFKFKNTRNFLKDKKVDLYIVPAVNKYYLTSKIERVHRTLKELFNKYFTAFNTVKWYNMLDDFVENYNTRHHRSIKMSPNEVGLIEELEIIKKDFERMVKKLQMNTFKIGDFVRIHNVKKLFEKGEVLYSTKVYRIVKQNYLNTFRLEDGEGNLLPKTYKDYELLKVGDKLEDIERPVSRTKFEEADKKATARNRFNRTGLSRQDVIREGRRVEEVMRPKRKKKVKKLKWKYKRGDKIQARARFFRGTELSYKTRKGKVQQTNSKYQGNIPAYNIKWEDENSGIWYDKESIEDENNITNI